MERGERLVRAGCSVVPVLMHACPALGLNKFSVTDPIPHVPAQCTKVRAYHPMHVRPHVSAPGPNNT